MQPLEDNGDLDDGLAGIASTHGPRAAARWCRNLLAGEELPPGTTRADLFIRLGDYLSMAGDQPGAGEAYRDAVADGSEAVFDARAFLASWCFENDKPAEGEALIAQIRAGRPTNPLLYEYVGEIYELCGDSAQALRWFTAGATRAMRDEATRPDLVYGLLAARRRVRLEQGFPEDDQDRAVRETQELNAR